MAVAIEEILSFTRNWFGNSHHACFVSPVKPTRGHLRSAGGPWSESKGWSAVQEARAALSLSLGSSPVLMPLTSTFFLQVRGTHWGVRPKREPKMSQMNSSASQHTAKDVSHSLPLFKSSEYNILKHTVYTRRVR